MTPRQFTGYRHTSLGSRTIDNERLDLMRQTILASNGESYFPYLIFTKD